MNAKATIVLIVTLLLAPGAAFPQPAKPNANQIEIGVIASAYTATRAPGRMGFGYSHAKRMVSAFQDPRYRMTAIIDPNTESDEKLRKALVSCGIDRDWVYGDDAESLKKFDVIVSGGNPNLYPEVVAAIDEAVYSGVGLVSLFCFGQEYPGDRGYEEHLRPLLGIRRSAHRHESNQTGRRYKVVADHPLLKEYKAGEIFPIMRCAAWWGPIDGNQLILPISATDENLFVTQAVCPLYTRRYGKGAMVISQWFDRAQGDKPIGASKLTYSEFYRRCVEWVVEQSDNPTFLGERPEFADIAKLIPRMQDTLLNKGVPADIILDFFDLDTLAAIYDKSLAEVDEFVKERIDAKRESATDEEISAFGSAQIQDIRVDRFLAQEIKQTLNVDVTGEIIAVELTDRDTQVYHFHNVSGSWRLFDCGAFDILAEVDSRGAFTRMATRANPALDGTTQHPAPSVGNLLEKLLKGGK